ncbi:MAG: hypothetical protein ABSF98_02515 [Bryobacteraceae bacterium]|jgi:hypothetical protein
MLLASASQMGQPAPTIRSQAGVVSLGKLCPADFPGGAIAQGSPYTPNTVATGTGIATALAEDAQSSTVYAAHPSDAAVSVIDPSALTVSVISLSSGRQPSLIAKGAGLYVISNSDLVKLSGNNSPAEYGSLTINSTSISDIAAIQYVVEVRRLIAVTTMRCSSRRRS